MAKQIYPWKRFWCRREGSYVLADGGFLYDPESEHAKLAGQEAVASLDEVRERFAVQAEQLMSANSLPGLKLRPFVLDASLP